MSEERAGEGQTTSEGEQFYEVPMPEVGEDVTEVMVAAWMKRPGDAVSAGEVLAEVQTEKVNMELESPVSGRVAEILVPEGTNATVGAPIARIAVEKA